MAVEIGVKESFEVRQQPVAEQPEAVQVGHRGGAVTLPTVRHLPVRLRQMDNQPAMILIGQPAAFLQQFRRTGVHRVGLDGDAEQVADGIEQTQVVGPDLSRSAGKHAEEQRRYLEEQLLQVQKMEEGDGPAYALLPASEVLRDGFRVRLHRKDVAIVLEAARELGVFLPVTALVEQIENGLISQGYGDEDMSVLARAIRELAAATAADAADIPLRELQQICMAPEPNDAERSMAELLRASLRELLAGFPEDQKSALALFGRALKGETVAVTEEFGRSGEARRSYELRFSPIRDSMGKVTGAAQIGRNITEREGSEEALRESEARFRAVLENMSEGVMLFDRQQNLFYQNQASLRIHGFVPAGV